MEGSGNKVSSVNILCYLSSRRVSVEEGIKALKGVQKMYREVQCNIFKLNKSLKVNTLLTMVSSVSCIDCPFL